MFDLEELKGSIEATKVVVCGDFTLDRHLYGRFQEDYFVQERETLASSGASLAAKALAALGFDVHVSGVVCEDERFIELQEMLFISSVDVSGLRTGLNLPTNVVTHYVELGSDRLLFSSAELSSHVYEQHYLSSLAESLKGASVCVFVENQFRSMSEDVMIRALGMARDSHVKTVIVPHVKSKQIRYLNVDFMIAKMDQILKLIHEMDVSESKTVGLSEFQKLCDLVCSDSGSVIGYGSNLFVSSCSEIYKANDIDEIPAFVGMGVLLAMGYRFDQCAFFASRMKKNADYKKILEQINES
jgi:bifunctional ADP-heptose synthase (sugar kinase/adenylyltransferase)